MYTISKHCYDHLSGDRPVMKPEVLARCVARLEPVFNRFDPETVHQVAVVIYRYATPKTLGYSKGDWLVLAVDIRTRKACSLYLRYSHQGKPAMAQVYVDAAGNPIE